MGGVQGQAERSAPILRPLLKFGAASTPRAKAHRDERRRGEARRGAGAANIFDAAAYRPPPFEPISGKEQRQRGARVVVLRGAQRKLSATKNNKERTEEGNGNEGRALLL